jgi:hypothetical protein
VLAILGTVYGPFNVLGVIAVALNLLLGMSLAYVAYVRSRTP